MAHRVILLITSTTVISTLSLHAALPIFNGRHSRPPPVALPRLPAIGEPLGLVGHFLNRFADGRDQPGMASDGDQQDRKSTRLNSSHVESSYAVFCLKKKRRSASSW